MSNSNKNKKLTDELVLLIRTGISYKDFSEILKIDQSHFYKVRNFKRHNIT